MKQAAAEIIGEYGPFPGIEKVNGIIYDGQHVWFASGDKLNALDPKTGEKVHALDVAAHAGTAFDGRYLFQLSGDSIQKIDPNSGRVLTTIPAPGGGGSGLTWAEGTLWMGQYRTGGSINSILAQGRFFVPSNPIASLRELLGSMASSGMPLLKATKATCGTSTRKREKSWRRSKCQRE
jgi:hypothetical protein